MTKDDMRDLLFGRAIKYLGDKYIKSKEFKYWRLLGTIEFIVNSNIQYESYDMDTMEEELYKYCKELKGDE